ncbi:MAG: right-handed parallel beta-helix repeat-containing protein, partial [Proteobacteria bacterium]|nr:right-handed parallel beta-helix repeat-containing protein [Pseudomonadota bacterium]
GILCLGPAAPTITGNTISNNTTGIYCDNYSTPTISGNTFTGNVTPISADINALLNIGANILNGNANNYLSTGGQLTKDITFKLSASPYVTTSVTVPAGRTLTIEPGVIVKLQQGYNTSYGYSAIYVYGTLIADGTPDQKIVFTSIKDDSYGGDTNGDGNGSSPAAADWVGIRFYSGSVNSVLDNTVVAYAGLGDSHEPQGGFSVYTESSSLTISNNEIKNNSLYDDVGIYCNSSSPNITGNTIWNHGRGILCLGPAAPTITGNTISNNTTGIYCDNYSTPTISGNTFTGNTGYAVLTDSRAIYLNTENNYWGNESGPYDPSDDRASGGLYNPTGTGDSVSDYVDYDPWLGQEPPTLISLASFTAIPANEKVILEWVTESEIDTVGFNLYRAESEDGEYVNINSSLIPAEGLATSGASYQFIDNDVQNRKTYFYKLEDIDLNGTSTMHGPVSTTPRKVIELRVKE